MLLKTSRRTFLKGLTLSGVAGSLGVWSFNARSSLSLPVAASLQGTQFDLTIGETAVNITGSERQAKTINGGLPGPVLRWKEGDTITLKVKNRLNEQTSIHWHGIILPANMDGVPGLSFMGIEPDDTYVYTFKVKQNGTYWYHRNRRGYTVPLSSMPGSQNRLLTIVSTWSCCLTGPMKILTAC